MWRGPGAQRQRACSPAATIHAMTLPDHAQPSSLVLHTTTPSCVRCPWQRKKRKGCSHGVPLHRCSPSSRPSTNMLDCAPQELLARENNVTHVRAPVVVVGDTHGQVCWLGRQAAVFVAHGPLAVLEPQPPSCNSCSVPSPQDPYEQHESACKRAVGVTTTSTARLPLPACRPALQHCPAHTVP